MIAMINTIDGRNNHTEEVKVLSWESNNKILVELQDGTKCWAISNPFTGMIYADPIYAKVE